MIFNFPNHFENFIDLCIIDSLDIGKLFFRCHDDAGYGAKSVCFEFGNVSSIDAIFLQLFDLVKIGLLKLGVLEIFLFLDHFFLLLGGFFSLLFHLL